jgi:hypothetical protein
MERERDQSVYLDEFVLVHHSEQDGDQSDQLPPTSTAATISSKDHDPLHV